jgi:uncharacterized protein (DUF302 family)
MEMTGFTLSATVAEPYDAVVARVRDLLADAGFGVLTEIDLQETLRAKLGVEVPRQVILGACRPQLAHLALQADHRIATMLPCNVVVAADGDTSARVEVFDPLVMTAFSDSGTLEEVAKEARRRLTGMMASLTGEAEEADAARA